MTSVDLLEATFGIPLPMLFPSLKGIFDESYVRD